MTFDKLIAVPMGKRVQDGAYRPIFEDGLWWIIREDRPELLPIATVDRADDHDDATRKEAEPYAKLFAAAPELLSVCKQMAEAWRYFSEYDVPIALGDKLLEAIAKAEGKL